MDTLTGFGTQEKAKGQSRPPSVKVLVVNMHSRMYGQTGEVITGDWDTARAGDFVTVTFKSAFRTMCMASRLLHQMDNREVLQIRKSGLQLLASE